MKNNLESISLNFDSLLDINPSLYVVVTTNLYIIGVSEAFLNFTFTKKNTIMGKELFESFPFFENTTTSSIEKNFNLSESIKCVIENRKPLISEAQKYKIPTQPNFNDKYLQLNIIPVLFDKNEVLCLIIKIEDVTEFEKMKKNLDEQIKRRNELEMLEKLHINELNKSELRFTKLFNLSPIPIFLINISDLRIVQVNNYFTNLVNLNSNQIIGKTGLELGILDTLNYEKLTKNIIKSGDKISEFEINIFNDTKEIRKMQVSSEMIEIDNCFCFLIAMNDITQQKKLENNLLEFNHFLDTILENIPNAVFVKVANTLNYIKINKAFETLFNFSQNELIGKTDYHLFSKEKADEQQKLEREIIDNKSLSIIDEEPFVSHNGLKWLRTKKIPVYDNNKPLYLIGISEDITERKKQQDSILQLNKELEAFSYSVSHDLRAPLRAVTGYAKILDEDYSTILDKEGKRILHTISENAEKMGHLIDNLLTFSRLGRKEILKKETDMNDIVNKAINEINKSTTHNATIVYNNLHAIYADTELMVQVMINFIENAIKYSSKVLEPLIEIKSEITGNEVVYSIKDNGAGFDMRYYDKLFGVFQRLHTMDEFEGTGVGLAIIQRIINKHGGKVWAEGKVENGATFYFSLQTK